jgi:hypothetical protein
MKLSTTYTALLAASFSAIGLAEILLEPVPLRLYTGESCELRWTTDRYYVSIHVLQKGIRRLCQY